ncbi:MAG: sodium:calcium antiporter [Candidatus Bathyarchaeales archaeon]
MLFEDLLLNVLILLVSLVVLNESSDLTIKNSVRVADITGMGKTTVGFILVAFSTSLPELFVSVFAAIGQESIGVAIGNVLGSNIVNICLILGICFLLAVIKCPNYTCFYPNMAKEEIGSLYFGIFVASVVPLILLYLGYASRFIGVVLLAIFIFYVYQLSKIRKVKEEGALGEERRKLRLYVFLTLLGVAGVIISSNFIVSSAKTIADSVGVPPVVIGSTIVAFGTSLPELATSIDATKKGHLDLALGNIVGSCFINITCILGVSLVASNFAVNMAAFSKLAMFSLIVNLFLWYFLSSEKASWRESAVLLFMYFVFLVVSFGGYEA